MHFHDWIDFKRGSLCNSKSYMIEVALFFLILGEGLFLFDFSLAFYKFSFCLIGHFVNFDFGLR